MQLVEDHAELPDVRPGVHRLLPEELLRGHVDRGADDRAVRGELWLRRIVVQELGDAEVEHLHERRAVWPRSEKEVRRLEIAVDDPERVRLGERVARLDHAIDRVRDVELPALLDDGAEIAPCQVLHHHVRRAALERPDVGHAGDVLALDADRRLRLAEKPRDDLLVPRELGLQELERHPLAEMHVHRGDDDSHRPFTEDFLDAVLAREDVPFVRRHLAWLSGRHVSSGSRKVGPPARITARHRRLLVKRSPSMESAPPGSWQGCGRRDPRFRGGASGRACEVGRAFV